VFCSNCGNHLAEEGNFCPNCGKGTRLLTELQDPEIVTKSGTVPKTSSILVLAFWLVAAIALVIALLALINVSRNPEPVTSSSPSSPSPTPLQTRAPSESSWGTGETVAACNELKPKVEETFSKIGTKFADSESDRALGVLLLAVNSASRTYSVNGLFAETSVPLGLRNFSDVIQRTMALTFDGDSNVLVWTQFVDSLKGDVLEPCGKVGVPIILTAD